MTQQERMIQMLRIGPVTYKEFHRACIPEFRSHINKLRKKGYTITDERYDRGKKWTLHESQPSLFEDCIAKPILEGYGS